MIEMGRNVRDLEAIEHQNERDYKDMGMTAIKLRLEAIETQGSGVDLGSTTLGKDIMALEFKNLQIAVKDFLMDTLKPKRGVKAAYVDLLATLVAKTYKDREDHLAGLMTLSALTTALSSAVKHGAQMSFSSLCLQVGQEIFVQSELDWLLSKMSPQGASGFVAKLGKRVSTYNKAYFVEHAIMAEGLTYFKTTAKAKQTLGAVLLTLIVTKSSFFDSEVFEADANAIVPSQALLDAYKANGRYLLLHAAKYPPMVVPPRPWVDFWRGGYIGVLGTGHLLRTHGTTSKFAKSYIHKQSQLDLSKVTEAVNAIQGTKWRINKKVLEVATHIMTHGGGWAGLSYTDLPPKPMILPPEPTKAQVKSYCKAMTRYYQNESIRKSHCLRTQTTLATAERFKIFDAIYFPCNLDFRGRVYPIPSFNPQGDDLTKGLLLFADPKPLTAPDKALKWFLVAGANHAGVDKVSFEDRIEWVKENHGSILESAKDPLGCHWWADQDEPFQMLSWCLEYARLQEYLETHDGDATGFITGAVIAFDGTCSGLQHFSALLRDPVGATAVNLVPQEKPNDIYRIVADKVNEVLERDARDGSEDTDKKLGTKSMALAWLTYGVTRKVTKRCVMTLAYGAKKYGFGDQVLEDTVRPDVVTHGDGSVFTIGARQCAMYIAGLIWDAVGTTVVAAVEGMAWLQDCARLVAKRDQVVSWSTPAGLLVQQHYTSRASEAYRLRCAGKLIRLYHYVEKDDQVDRRRQASGIAPNFIHSLDAAHLMLTIDNCVAHGLNAFATVHDSFGTELEDAETLFELVRVNFFRMYTESDPLDTFRQHMALLAGPEVELPELPSKGTLDLKVVLDSKYIFC